MLLQLLLPTPLSRTAVSMRTANPPRQEQLMDLRPPLPPYPPAGYALPSHGHLFPEATPPHVPVSRGHQHTYGRRLHCPATLLSLVARLLHF
jgi:hypothetical protein